MACLTLTWTVFYFMLQECWCSPFACLVGSWPVLICFFFRSFSRCIFFCRSKSVFFFFLLETLIYPPEQTAKQHILKRCPFFRQSGACKLGVELAYDALLQPALHIENYFFSRFSLCLCLFSSLSFLVIGFFLLLPMLNAITAPKVIKTGIKLLWLKFSKKERKEIVGTK